MARVKGGEYISMQEAGFCKMNLLVREMLGMLLTDVFRTRRSPEWHALRPSLH